MTQYQSPLDWPLGWPRARFRNRSRFGRNRSAWAAAEGLARELHLLECARDVVITTNLHVRVDGRGYISNQGRLQDPGASVYFKLKGKDTVLAVDAWSTVEENLHALALHVDSIRGQGRWGVGTVQRAFEGYAALPPANHDWWRDELGLDPGPFTESDVTTLFRGAAKMVHPDAGGTNDGMDRLVKARDAALQHLKQGT